MTTRQKIWLDAHYDALASIKVTPGGITTADLLNDGEYRLVIADLSQRLKVYKGPALVAQYNLVDKPSAVVTFKMKKETPVLVAIGCGEAVYVYVQIPNGGSLQPYYKLILPKVSIAEEETEIWKKLNANEIGVKQAIDSLQSLQDSKSLSSRSLNLIGLMWSIPSEESMLPRSQEEFVSTYKSLPLDQSDCVTCLGVLPMHAAVSIGLPTQATGRLVVGTESGKVLIYDDNTSEVSDTIVLPAGSVPFQLSVAGEAEVDYRILVACRDGQVFTIRDGKLSKSVLHIESPIIQVIRFARKILVAAGGGKLHTYSLKGKRTGTTEYMKEIVGLTLMTISSDRIFQGYMVGFASGEVMIYDGSQLIGNVWLPGRPETISFLPFGREANCLIAILHSGAIVVKLLHRKADLSSPDDSVLGPPKEQDVPLNIPDKSKILLEYAEKEQQRAQQIHYTFQIDLNRLKLRASKMYLQMLNGLAQGDGLNDSKHDSIIVQAEIIGLGPIWNIRIFIESSKERETQQDLICLILASDIYFVPRSHFHIPVLLPSVQQTFIEKLELSPEKTSQIKNSPEEEYEPGFVSILVGKPVSGRFTPSGSVILQMPVCDASFVAVLSDP